MTATFADPSCFTEKWVLGFTPDPIESVADWCDAHIQLPSGLTAEAGRWRTARTPYLREILDELSPTSPTEEVIVMKGAQLGFTQAGTNWLGYLMHRAPGPMMILEPTTDVVKKFSRLRIRPLLTTTDVLKGRVREQRSRDAANTMLLKEFDGGVLVLTGANSAVGLRFMPVRYLMLDEEDAYPQDIDKEGHPSDLAAKRTTSFARRKIFRLSTPLDHSTSVIEPGFERGSRGRYYVPCPICLHPQPLRWSGIVFTFDGVKDPSRASYQCEACHHLIPESQKTWMLENGKWVHEDPTNPVKSYHLNGLYAPYGWKPVSWPALVRDFLQGDEKAKRGDKRKLKVFTNTVLAETWQDHGEQVQHSALYNRRETYPAEVPDSVLVLTAAVDVQDNRLEAECVGWGLGEESWSIDYQRWYGSPAQAEVWQSLDDWLQKSWQSAHGFAMRIIQAVVDAGGHHAKGAYDFVRKRQGRRVYAVRGSNQPGAPLVSRPTQRNLGKVNLFMVGTDAAKDILFDRLKLTDFGPGYLHFPDTPTYDEEYFQQLTAEEKRKKFSHGVLQGTYYHKIRARNEALDLKVYNLAALAILNPNLEALAAEQRGQRPMPQPAPNDERPSNWVRRGERGAWNRR